MTTSTSSDAACEMLSALADGELQNEEISAALLACTHEGDAALHRWRSYHVIGDVLRSPVAVVAAPSDVQFLKRLSRRLAREQARAGGVSLAPDLPAIAAYSSVPPLGAPTAPPVAVPRAASNEDVFRWKLVAGFASLAAVTAITWSAASFLLPAPAPQLAGGPATEQVIIASPNGPVVRDARLEELLAAHRQLGGATALQAPSGFLQNAAFAAPMDGRR